MTLNRTWTLILIFLAGTWTAVGLTMWLTEDQVSSVDKVLGLMQEAPWMENPNLNDQLRGAYLDRVVASQNLLSFSERRDLREEGEETLRAFFESLSEAEQHRYVDGTTEQHLKKVVKILDNMSEDTRKAISARLRRELGGRGERPREGQGGPPPGGAPGSVEGGLDELAGMALEMQYRDAKPARKLEMAQMLDNMQSFLQGFRR